MHLTISTHECWDTLRTLLQDDSDPGARPILENIDAIESLVTGKDGRLIAFAESRYPYRFAGAVAVSRGSCGIVRMHFYYIYEEFRGFPRSLEIMRKLFRSVHEFGVKSHYGYVFVHAPDGESFQSQHEMFLPRSIEQRSETLPSGHAVTTYSISREQFLRFCA